jgi:hypothetical protein
MAILPAFHTTVDAPAVKVRHPNRPAKHGHNRRACGVCHSNKKFGHKFTDLEAVIRSEVAGIIYRGPDSN